jgi:hypothetical protein
MEGLLMAGFLLHHYERMRGSVVVVGLFSVVVGWWRDFDPPQHRFGIKMIWCKGMRFVIVVIFETYAMSAVFWVAVTVYAVAFCGKLDFTP